VLLRIADRRDIFHELLVAIFGILIGAFSTFFTKFIESEYQYQRNLTVLEYNGNCDPAPARGNNYPHAVDCKLSVKVIGPKPAKGIRLSVLASGNASDSNSVPRVSTKSLVLLPSFAPPDPPPQTESNSLDTGSAAVYATRMREPQQIIWTVTVDSKDTIDLKNQIAPTVTAEDASVQIEDGSSWRWKRWMPVGAIALILPGSVALLLLIAMLLLRKRA
jgi:hypothetical protein